MPWARALCRLAASPRARGSRHRRAAHGRALPWALVGALVSSASAQAADVRTVSRTIGEGYMVRQPGPEGTLLSRRRLVQYVGIGVYRILPPKRVDELQRAPEDGQLQVVSSLRIRHDFGTFRRSAQGASAGLLNAIDGRQLDMLYGYLEGRNLGGAVDFRVGRQFEMSGLDFYAFDGGWIRARTPAHLAFEAFGGFTVNASDILGLVDYAPDGTSNTPSDSITTPMVGAAFAMDSVKFMDARFAYRRTWTPERFGRDLEGTDGSRGLGRGVDQEFVTATLALRLAAGKVSPSFAARYNLGTDRLDDTSAMLSWALTDLHTLRAQYIRTVPSFDLDSIFNVFASEAIEDVRAVYEVRPGPYWTLYGRFQGRIFRADTTAALATAPDRRTRFGGGGATGFAYRRRRFAARGDLFGMAGEGGGRIGGDLDTRTHVVYDRLALDARLYAVGYRDDLVAARRGYSAALQLGGNLRMAHGIYLNLVGEQLFTSFYRSAFRALAMLSVDWAVRGGRR
ncbi:MAG: hypothetical protein IPH07_04950 [Deltaproteobacteria bacterium]|nr:hypothetical protein [Deltaproteobacteria bacterium]MBK8719467.1 hypothetical protein [Deltaproteobacteria bacterium]MBP7290678.1 hypothetical protein [Nannocystaceae bacterium]